jgi:hypothetical protein
MSGIDALECTSKDYRMLQPGGSQIVRKVKPAEARVSPFDRRGGAEWVNKISSSPPSDVWSIFAAARNWPYLGRG